MGVSTVEPTYPCSFGRMQKLVGLVVFWGSQLSVFWIQPAGGLVLLISIWLTSSTWLGFYCLQNNCRVWGFPGAQVVKNLPASTGEIRHVFLIPESGKIPWSRAWQPTLTWRISWTKQPGSIGGRKESDTNEAT